MKTLVRKTAVTGAILGLALIGPALAQEAGMKMDSMKDMDMSGMSCCGDMAPGFGVINGVDLDAFKQSMMSMMKGDGMMDCNMGGHGSMSGMSGKDHDDTDH